MSHEAAFYLLRTGCPWRLLPCCFPPLAPSSLALPLALAASPVHAEDRVLQVVSPCEVSSLDPTDTGYIAERLGVPSR
jgi:hypothetical protein